MTADPVPSLARDPHSYANPNEVVVRHLDLDLDVHFERRVLSGSATLSVDAATAANVVVLDTRDLTVVDVAWLTPSGRAAAEFWCGDPDALLGCSLTVRLPTREPGEDLTLKVDYETGPEASALQWLTPAQTAGQQHPFLFTQSQAIHARSWIPIQDSPGVRVTYTARVTVPQGLRAVMGAAIESQSSEGDRWVFRFRMELPIPSYLIALAVGELAFQDLGERVGVYAEPSVLPVAAWEFADTEAMIVATERLYGPYRWGRYDLLVLPASFPFGGMENPRLTFATPTILAGDKSLVSLIAHELAHSWSGNLVTNATWNDFWLNEGFTVYIERRILEEVYGRSRAAMESVLGYRTLRAALGRLQAVDTRLQLALEGRDPDDGMTPVAYEKGALFLRRLEGVFGRARFDDFLRGYFDAFAFRSLTTADFLAHLEQTLALDEAVPLSSVDMTAWLTGSGLPSDAPEPYSDRLARVDALGHEWLTRVRPLARLSTEIWTTQEWLQFLAVLPSDLPSERLRELDGAFQLTASTNDEIAHAWFLLTISCGYHAADERLAAFLTRIGRRKLVQPLYEALIETSGGRARALDIYETARPGYHPITVETIDALLGLDAAPSSPR